MIWQIASAIHICNVNPLAAENDGERWADSPPPRFPDPSLINLRVKTVLRKCIQ